MSDESPPLSLDEVMQRVSDHCNAHAKKVNAPFSIKAMQMLLAEIQELRQQINDLNRWRPMDAMIEFQYEEGPKRARSPQDLIHDGLPTNYAKYPTHWRVG